MPFMSKSTSTSLILLGILSVVVGIIALAWPGVTVFALVLLFAVYAFIDAGLEAVRAFSSRTAGPVLGHLLLGLLSLAAGVIAVVWPAPTALVLVLVIGIWAVIGGIVEMVSGCGSGEAAGTRAVYILTGLVSTALGVVLFARRGVGAITLALLFGLFSMIYGCSRITLGVQVHQLHAQRRSAQPPSALRTAAGEPRRARAPAPDLRFRAPADPLCDGGTAMLKPNPPAEGSPAPPAPTAPAATAATPQPGRAAAPPRRHGQLRRLLGILGPGLVTGAADDDPSGLPTYSPPAPPFASGHL